MSDNHALIVDDDRFIRGIVDRTLKEAGFKTVQAENGDMALEVIKDYDPDLIVLDIWMPGKHDGLGVCQKIRSDSRYDKALIVMITASDHRKIADRCLAAGANILIPKPFSPKNFKEQVMALYRDHKRRRL